MSMSASINKGDAAEARSWGCRTERKKDQHFQLQQAVRSAQLQCTPETALLNHAQTWCWADALEDPSISGLWFFSEQEKRTAMSSVAYSGVTRRWIKHRFKENKAEKSFTGKMCFLEKLPGENQYKHWQLFLLGISLQNCSASELIFMLLWYIETAMKIT